MQAVLSDDTRMAVKFIVPETIIAALDGWQCSKVIDISVRQYYRWLLSGAIESTRISILFVVYYFGAVKKRNL